MVDGAGARPRITVCASGCGAEGGGGEEGGEGLAPDDGGLVLADVGARGDFVVEGAVRALERAEVDRRVVVAVRVRREVDEEVGSVADRELLEPQDVSAGFAFDEERVSVSEVEAVGTLELALADDVWFEAGG